MGERSDRIVTATFVIVFIAAIAAYVYVSLPKEMQEKAEKSYVLTVKYGDTTIKYTMDDLKAMESVSGYGGYVKKTNATVGPYLYKGVDVKYLLQSFSLPENFSVTIIASDGYQRNFTSDEIDGKVDIYDSNGTYLGRGNLSMIIAYEKEGKDLDEDEGPLRIAFVSEDGYLTKSSLWIRNVITIEINV